MFSIFPVKYHLNVLPLFYKHLVIITKIFKGNELNLKIKSARINSINNSFNKNKQWFEREKINKKKRKNKILLTTSITHNIEFTST